MPRQKLSANNNIIFDRVVDFGDGVSLHFVIDAIRFPTIVDRYRTALLMARSIPSHTVQQIDPTSDMAQAILQMNSNWQNDPQRVTALAESFYEEQRQEAQYEATLLALIAHPSNVFPEEPAPYDEEDYSELPGLPSFPKPIRDLRNPTERRLKQMYDFYTASPDRMKQFMDTVNDCWAALAQMAQRVRGETGGFRS